MLVESKKNKKAIRKNPLGRPKVTCTSPSDGTAKIQKNNKYIIIKNLIKYGHSLHYRRNKTRFIELL